MVPCHVSPVLSPSAIVTSCPGSGDTALQWLTISLLPGIGSATLCRLARRYSTPSSLVSQVGRDPDISPRLARILTDPALRRTAEKKAGQQLEVLKRHHVSLTCHDGPEYPSRLRTLADFPVLLFYRGDISRLAGPAVALVGSRAATGYGRDVAYRLAADLARRGITVVSGVAAGIDGAAHSGALSVDGFTAGVLGCGIDVVYPQAHKKLYGEIGDRGVLISEYPCGTRPDGFRFPARNRIISGLVQGVVVVEATLRSGSLITARLALDQGREVFAVPGRVDSAKSAGTHRLLQQGAHLVQSADDIVRELGLAGCRVDSDLAPAPRPDDAATGDSQRILDCLDVYPVDIDTIMRVSGLEMARVLDLLLQLELQGLVRQRPGQLYEKVMLT